MHARRIQLPVAIRRIAGRQSLLRTRNRIGDRFRSDGIPQPLGFDVRSAKQSRELIRILRSKAEEAGTELILVDSRNTSRTCSGCGNVKVDFQLSERTYQCECCGMAMDRDRNAAINILRRGLNTQTLRSAVNGRLCRPRWKETARGHEKVTNTLVS